MNAPISCRSGLPARSFRHVRYASLAAFAAFALTMAPAAHADTIVQYDLGSIVFADGGTATGVFSIDEDTGYVFGSDITVTDSAASESPDTFNNSDITSEFDSYGLNVAVFNTNGDGFTLNWADPVDSTTQAVTSGAYYYDGGSEQTAVTSGYIQVPEPASLVLLGAAVSGLGLLRRRKKVALTAC